MTLINPNTMVDSLLITSALALLVAIGLHMGWMASNNINDEVFDLVCIIIIGLIFAVSIYNTSHLLSRGIVPVAYNFVIPSGLIFFLYFLMAAFRPTPYNSNHKGLRDWSFGLGAASF